ncbi:MAG: RING finger domain-containing protein, partial [Candidatus Thorarchaeota archaeon]
SISCQIILFIHFIYFFNVLERKEATQQLKDEIRPLILELIRDKLEENIKEIDEMDKKYDLTGYGLGKINLNELMNQKFKDFLPKIVDYYFKGLDKRFQVIASKVENPEEFIELVNSCYNKINNFASKVDEIDTWVLRFDNILKPYANITDSLKKSIANLSSEIYRRKEEYLNYMNNIRDESLRIELRNFVDIKIEAVNKLINSYEDETSVIIREELPQLREIRDLLTEYKEKIDKIKEEVYTKLEAYKEHNIDMYQVIKHWEDNFNRKKQQLTFLLTVLINKIFKSFSDLIDKESIMFAEINEITKQAENFEGLPINFALSSFLANRLSENELRDRITEINAKINQLTSSLGLYQIEASKLEEILSNKVKTREGVSASNVQCTVCHKNINFAKDKLITCPFCGSTYHYLCVADWLSKYNSCPMCQNQFLDPNLGIFENE